MGTTVMLTLVPPEIIDISTRPTIFFAGPMQGARNWHRDAEHILRGLGCDCIITSPNRETSSDHRVNYKDGLQRKWERYYLRHAREYGLVMFWLENQHDVIAGRDFAQTTRFELGEQCGRNFYNQKKNLFVVGFDASFPGTNYLTETCKEEYPHIDLCTSLVETCQAAYIELATR